MNGEKTLSAIRESERPRSRVEDKNGTIKDQIRDIGAHDGMRFPDLIRFGPNQPPETGVPTDPAMQIAGNDNIADKADFTSSRRRITAS